MTTQLKNEIVQALEQYMQEHNISQSELAEHSGVNASYIINMRKGDFTVKSAGKTINISDKWFNRIALFIGFATEKSYWTTQQTQQFKGILAALTDAKANAETTILIGETGCGKTYTCKLFAQKNPTEVFIVKVGSCDNIGDLIDKVLAQLKITVQFKSKSSKLRLIAQTMRNMSENGQEPVLIFDEAEYMKQPALCAIKELYDALNTWCAIVLIGTEQLVSNIEKLKNRNKAGIPQLYRRIRYRMRPLPKIDRNYKDFLNGIEPNLKKWLQKNCDNYGELHDVLVPAMREAERTNQELTEDFVKMILRID